MEDYIVSARKYRPTTFDSVVGQPSITTTLKNAIINDHLAQAFLFCGPRGVGKTTCARILAKTINCFNRTENIEPCEECESCKSFNEGHSLNIYELDAASNNSVEDIRNLIDQVRFAPQIGSYKVYIIDEVHMLSSAAFNAFLKTLEEPPKHAIFILATTEKHKIIPTILSRCQVFDFNRIQIEDIAQHLQYIAEKENITTEEDALHILAQKADGALRDALSMFDQMVSFSGNEVTYKGVIENLNILDYDYYFKVTDAILNKNIPSALLIFNEILAKGFDGHNFIVGLAGHFRNLLVCKDQQTLSLLEAGVNIKKRYQVQSENCSQNFILSALNITNKTDNQYKTSKNPRLLVELALMQLCSIGDKPFREEKKTPVIEKSKTSGQPKSPSPATATPTPAPENKITDDKKQVSSAPSGEPQQEKEPEAKPPLPVQNKVDENPTKAKPEEKEPGKPEDETNSSNPEENNSSAETTEQNKSENTNNTNTTPPSNSVKVSNNKSWKSKTSLSELTKKEEQDEGEEEESVSGKPENEFSQDKLEEAWKELTNHFESENSTVFAALNKRKPKLKENFNIEVTTDNKAQKDELQDHRSKILNLLRKRLKNYAANLEVIVVKNEKSQKAYTPEEKFEKLAEENPTLKKFKDQLDLEINL